MTDYNFVVNEHFDQKRIDQVVAQQFPKISRSKVSKIIKNNTWLFHIFFVTSIIN